MDFSNRPQVTQARATAGDPASRNEDALRRCTLSNSFLKAGDYEGAVEALEGFWRGAGERPATEGLDPRAAGEVLVQAGRLTSALGGARRIEGAQEAAKNLLSEGAGLFERLGDAPKVAEARTDLGVCYWREGAFEEARVVLRAALEGLAREDEELRALALTRLAIVELSAGLQPRRGRAARRGRPARRGVRERHHQGQLPRRARQRLRRAGRRGRRRDARPRARRAHRRELSSGTSRTHALPRQQREQPRHPLQPHRASRGGARAPRARTLAPCLSEGRGHRRAVRRDAGARARRRGPVRRGRAGRALGRARLRGRRPSGAPRRGADDARRRAGARGPTRGGAPEPRARRPKSRRPRATARARGWPRSR